MAKSGAPGDDGSRVRPAEPAPPAVSQPSLATNPSAAGDTSLAAEGPFASVLLNSAGAAPPAEFGRYRLIRPLGEGAMGTVYLAEDTQLLRQVALKIPQLGDARAGTRLERFYREARLAATLHHPNICPIFDVGEHQGTHFISMAFIPGKPLSVYARPDKLPPQKTAAAVIRKIALALHEAHTRGVIHRDLKPANIMIDQRGEPIVMDFGLARQTGSTDQAQLTHTGAILGTPAYMSPEQVSGQPGAVGEAADIYALGVILYQLLTGRLPFEGSVVSVLAQIATQEAAPPGTHRADLNPALQAICLKAMARDAAARYGSMKAFAAALADFLRQPRPAAPEAPQETPGETPADGEFAQLAFDSGSVVDRYRPRSRASGSRRPAPNRACVSLLVERARILPGWGRLVAAGSLAGLVVLAASLALDHAEAPPADSSPRAESATTGRADQPNGNEAVGRTESDAPTPEPERPAVAKANLAFFNPADLNANWTGNIYYWRVRDGSIVGTPVKGRAAHTFLCSRKTYRDFELQFKVRRKNGVGNSGLQFRSRLSDPGNFVVVGPQIEIDSSDHNPPPGSALNEPDGKPTLPVKNKELIRRIWKNDDFNEIRLRCVGNAVSVWIAGILVLDETYANLPEEGVIAWQMHGQRPPEDIEFKEIQFLDLSGGLPAATSKAKPAEAPASTASKPDGFVSLFNGNDLTGWTTHPRQKGNWRVENGILVGRGNTSHLYTTRTDYTDFHLRVEARINRPGNSGICFHSTFGPRYPEKNPGFPLGYEAQIAGLGLEGNMKTGSLYAGPGRQVPCQSTPPLQAGEWFVLEIIAEGNRLTFKVDGKQTLSYVDPERRYPKGYIALQTHNDKTVVEFRKVEIKAR